MPDTIDLSGPAHIPAAAVSNPAVAAAAEAAAAAQRDSSGSEAAPDSDEDIEPEEMQAALTKQQEADQVAREEVKVPDECRKDWRAAMQWAMGVKEGADLLTPDYNEVLQAVQPRQIGERVPGIDPAAIARQFMQQQQLLQQQQQQAAVAAQQQALAAVGVVGMQPVLPHQAMVLSQMQALSTFQQQQQHHQQ